ncbi:sulfur carrier protein ThiS [Salirhabdus salicampi]|uniref:sulfur carrier protein ThiS n=1 Tax=Salirhabdus salicampi TaxID=476102 RepID=UPI0020C2CDA1|nr:sulfur carrier protein ThiS [Salirhabdus salicampi]MCP8616253.1 sulfur carrier protein ThiS [Salirhabdus salicampi]
MLIIQVNGDQLEIPADVNNVYRLLEHFDVEGKVTIIEVNGRIIEKANYEEQQLKDHDQIEILHFVGGG